MQFPGKHHIVRRYGYYNEALSHHKLRAIILFSHIFRKIFGKQQILWI
jgi:hypothetical protein